MENPKDYSAGVQKCDLCGPLTICEQEEGKMREVNNMGITYYAGKGIKECRAQMQGLGPEVMLSELHEGVNQMTSE